MNTRSSLAAAVAAAAAITCGVTAAAASPTGSRAVRPVSTAHPAARALEIRGFRPAARSGLPRVQPPRISAGPADLSTNWSGYTAIAQKNVALRWVSASWNVPSLRATGCAPGTSGYAYAVNWIGLDGFGSTPNGTSNTGEEIGTEAYCDSSGTISYYGWYDMYPEAAQYFGQIFPGDAVTASIYHDASNGLYSLVLTDVTQQGVISAQAACPAGDTCRNATAEVIAGAAGSGPPADNLADFGMVNYTGANVTSRDGTRGTMAAAHLWTSDQVIMADSTGNYLATPSPLYGGQAFNVTWDRSS